MATSFKIESGVQLLARLNKKPHIENFYPALFQSGPKPGEVIEIFSDSNLRPLLDDLMSEALSTCFVKDEIGILFFNCSTNFYPEKLLTSLRNKIFFHMKKLNKHLNEEIQYELLKKMLSNFYLVQIFDATQLYTTIHNLESILLQFPNIAMIIFDDITAFYWSEQTLKINKMDVYIKNILHMIQKVTKEHKTTVLYARPEFFSSSKDKLENLEPCSATPSFEKINYRIQIVHSKISTYQANIKTFNNLFKSMFFIEEDIIKWV